MIKKSINHNLRDENKRPIRWDAHGCPPFRIGSDLSFLKRYKNSGINFLSLNVGFDLTTQIETLNIIEYFHRWVKMNSDEYVIIGTSTDIRECERSGKMALAFDVEGCNILNDDVSLVYELNSLGVRQIALAYNKNNSFGGGCLDDDNGLTALGKYLVEVCNDVGMIIDCSHAGYKTSMEIIHLSSYPVIFSHSNPFGLFQHPRNIGDAQIIACAEKGGVVGISGVGLFLGNNEVQSEKIVDHIDYIANVAGVEHIGIGLDCIFAEEEIKEYVSQNTDIFPIEHGFSNVKVAVPEQFSEIMRLLSGRGYTESNIDKILGENFMRIAECVWK